jgi:histone H3/H4
MGCDDFRERAGLVFSVVGVAAAASQTHGGVLLTPRAAVGLAAVLEYLTAEVAELSGNAARDNRACTITPRHIRLAVECDVELNATLNNRAAIRDGGALPKPDWISKYTRSCRSDVQPFIEVFIGMLEAAPERVLIDPRDGNHKSLRPQEDDDFGNYDEWRLCPMPELDMICALSQAGRQASALDALSPCQQAALECFFLDGDQLRLKRLEDIRYATTQSVGFCIGHHKFRCLLGVIGQDVKTDLVYTEEAIDALQCAAEEYLVRMYQCANMTALHSNRLRVQPRDVMLARLMNGESL